MLQTFKIIPFRQNHVIDSIRGEFEICEQQITISYQLSGRIDDVCWPDRQVPPTRESGLWKRTCLEFFIGPNKSPNYWEFNLSPSGNWNCFSFSDLRCDMQESQALTLSSFSCDIEKNNVACTAKIDCQDITLEDVRVGVSAVIEHKSGFSYYALAHGPAAVTHSPDFHARENHLLLL